MQRAHVCYLRSPGESITESESLSTVGASKSRLKYVMLHHCTAQLVAASSLKEASESNLNFLFCSAHSELRCCSLKASEREQNQPLSRKEDPVCVFINC